jgi:hypothetical protein
MHASVPASSLKTVSEYAVKSSMMITLSFGLLVTTSGRFRRDKATTEVIDELFRHCWSASEPMKPVAPLNIIFIVELSLDGNEMIKQSATL